MPSLSTMPLPRLIEPKYNVDRVLFANDKFELIYKIQVPSLGVYLPSVSFYGKNIKLYLPYDLYIG